ncbi:hypothetical protein HHK36_004674 [Tetracentron sinense]|uniref:Saposin B-type domain-containing protein n=1 Tax=Tetracentron sinense TaxID=13715 RepID=A0A834ZKC5_TETSI|nr:hypothetical protein HHK36_004674 [Tetracentron sinense]
MDIRILSLFSAFLVLLVNVDARNVIMFQDVGKSTNDGIASSLQWLERVGSVIVSKEGLSPEFICLSCLEVSRSVEKVLLDPVLPEKIGLFANDACHILPADLRVKCVEMLELYTNKAILFLQVYFSEKNLCNSTGLCPENAYTLPMLSLSKDQLFSVVHLVRDLTTENGANSRLLTKQQMLQPVIQRLTDKVSKFLMFFFPSSHVVTSRPWSGKEGSTIQDSPVLVSAPVRRPYDVPSNPTLVAEVLCRRYIMYRSTAQQSSAQMTEHAHPYSRRCSEASP